MKSCMLTGSFDPFTMGHLDMVQRVCGVFDKVYVAVLVNPQKKYLFSVDQRLKIIHQAVQSYPNVRVISYAGMTADLAKELGVDYLVRGVRGVTDFEYEMEMADFNLQEGGIDTICLMSSRWKHVSSSEARAFLLSGGNLHGIVPDACIESVEKFYYENK